MAAMLYCIFRKSPHSWAARYNTWLLIKLTPKGIVFSFLFLFLFFSFKVPHWSSVSAVCREEKERAAAAAADAAEAQSAPAVQGKEAAEKAAKKLEGNAR